MAQQIRHCGWCRGPLHTKQSKFCSRSCLAQHRQNLRTAHVRNVIRITLERGLKTCGRCKEEKTFPSEFYKKTSNAPRRLDRYDWLCKACRNENTKAYQAKHPAKVIAWKKKHYETKGKFATKDKSYRKFNASAAAYDLQLHAQNGRCAICLQEPAPGRMRLAFDHNHATGFARGVLCTLCNAALGSMLDRKDLLLAAIRYLEHWEKEHRLMDGTNGL